MKPISWAVSGILFSWRSSFTFSCVFSGFISSDNIPWRYFRHLNERVRVIIKVSTNDVFWTWIHLRGSQTGFGWYNLNKLQCVIRYDIFYVMWQMKEQILQSYLRPPSQFSYHRTIPFWIIYTLSLIGYVRHTEEIITRT